MRSPVLLLCNQLDLEASHPSAWCWVIHILICRQRLDLMKADRFLFFPFIISKAILTWARLTLWKLQWEPTHVGQSHLLPENIFPDADNPSFKMHSLKLRAAKVMPDTHPILIIKHTHTHTHTHTHQPSRTRVESKKLEAPDAVCLLAYQRCRERQGWSWTRSIHHQIWRRARREEIRDEFKHKSIRGSIKHIEHKGDRLAILKIQDVKRQQCWYCACVSIFYGSGIVLRVSHAVSHSVLMCACVCVCVRARVRVCVCTQLCPTLCSQAPPLMEFSRQEYWGGLLFPPLGDLSDPGIEPEFLVSPTLVGRFFTTEPELQLLSPLFYKWGYWGLERWPVCQSHTAMK